MRILVLPADKGGCGHYRMIWPAEALASHDVTLSHDHTFQAFWQPSVIGPHQMVGLAEPVDADVVVMQRPLHRHKYQLISVLQAQGIAVVVEVDDDFHSIHPLNVAWKGTSPLHDPESNRDWLMKSCQQADLVTVTTPALAERYGAHGRVRVLPNYVPEHYLAVEKPEHDGVIVGWSGSVATHPKDLDVTQGAVAEVVDGHSFFVVGTGKHVQERLGLKETPRACGWVPIEDYPNALSCMDVGIVPLAPHAFNEAKSWLKGLEMAAVGVPFIASSTGPYRELRDLGIGVLAENRDEWKSKLNALVRFPALREECAQAWREVARGMTIEAHAEDWLEAWEDAFFARKAQAA